MEPYIRKNTDLRKTASSSFEKDFFKLMNNSVFGKTIENIRKRQNVILVDDRKLAKKLSSKPNFERLTIFDKNLVAVHMKKTEVYFNKPIYVGQAIFLFCCFPFSFFVILSVPDHLLKSGFVSASGMAIFANAPFAETHSKKMCL